MKDERVGDDRALLVVAGLKKHFPIHAGVLRRATGMVYALDGVSFTVERGETFGVVGESGSGKTTLARCIVGLLEPTDGQVVFESAVARSKDVKRRVQMVFQDPYSSLNPRMRVGAIVSEPLFIHRVGTKADRAARAVELLGRVGLRPEHARRYPHEFSGGERQRIGIARALSLDPKLMICDEPVSALDVSVQAQVLNLLKDLQIESGFTCLLIAHNLSVVEYAADRIMVMYLGKVCEIADSRSLYTAPLHPYTEALLSSIPKIHPRSGRQRFVLPGSPPDPSRPPSGCRFHTRCPYAVDRCRTVEPVLVALSDRPGRFVACHRADELSLTGYVE